MRELKAACMLFVLLTLVTGVAYPALVTLAGQALFGDRAAGSMIFRDGRAVGSRLLGQSVTDPRYFWGRPSATSPAPNNTAASSGSNLAVTNPQLLGAVKDRLAALRAADPSNRAKIPVDLVTASASGLDPHISPAAALYQTARVARLRDIPAERVRALVAANTQGRTFGILGEPRVNVLELNLALDAPTK